jgi:pimeloyl-ACP methyl ester carboxylesterase
MTNTPTMPETARAARFGDASNITAPTRFIETRLETYAYRRFGGGAAPPLVFLQHFTGTLDNWDPAVTDALARDREVILFESAGVGRSSGEVPTAIAGMTNHLLAFAEALRLTQIDLLGFSLGGMVAQQAALDRPSLVRKMLLVGTAPEGGEDIMHLEKPELRKILEDPGLSGYQVLVKLFFTSSAASQAAGQAYAERLGARTQDREPISGPKVVQAQLAAFRAWERVEGERFGKLRRITRPCLVVNGGLRQHDSGQKFVFPGRAPAQRHAVDLPRRRSWLALPVPRLLRTAGDAVPGFVRFT